MRHREWFLQGCAFEFCLMRQKKWSSQNLTSWTSSTTYIWAQKCESVYVCVLWKCVCVEGSIYIVAKVWLTRCIICCSQSQLHAHFSPLLSMASPMVILKWQTVILHNYTLPSWSHCKDGADIIILAMLGSHMFQWAMHAFMHGHDWRGHSKRTNATYQWVYGIWWFGGLPYECQNPYT